MIINKGRRFYIISLAALAALSAYPLINGLRMVYFSITNGSIGQEQYAKYVVPYAAICISLLFFAALQPVFFKLKRFAFPVGIALAFGVFFAAELFFEAIQIRVTGVTLIDVSAMAPALSNAALTPALSNAVLTPALSNAVLTPALSNTALTPALSNAALATGVQGTLLANTATADVWQAFLCVATPAVSEQTLTLAPRDGLFNLIGNSAYKFHYYMISLILITMVCGLVYSIRKMLRDNNTELRKPVILRGVSTTALAVICVFANATGFFREAAPVQTPLASALTGLFFVILSAAAGIYAGSYLTGKSVLPRLGIPVLLSLCAAALMYFGEAAMMGGELYLFGTGWFFRGIPGIILAPADILIVLFSGGLSWLVLGVAGKHGLAEIENGKLKMEN